MQYFERKNPKFAAAAIFVYIVFLFILTWNTIVQIELSGTSPYGYCKIHTSYMYNRTTTTTIEQPERFINYEITPRQKRMKKGAYTTVYDLSLVSNTKKYDLRRGFGKPSDAKIVGEEIMRCFREKAYPCNIKMY